MLKIDNSPAFAGKNLKITYELNKDRKYLFNEVLDIIKETPVPATIGNGSCTITPPSGSKNIDKVIGNLTKAGINFDTIA